MWGGEGRPRGQCPGDVVVPVADVIVNGPPGRTTAVESMTGRAGPRHRPRGTTLTLRPRKRRVPERNGDPHLSRDRRRFHPIQDPHPGENAGLERDERSGERRGLLGLASQILTSGTACVRAVAVAGALAALVTGTIVAAGIARIDVGPIHVTVRDTPLSGH